MKKERPVWDLMHRRKQQKQKSFTYAQQMARTLKNLTGVNVFENSRRTDVIEIRSLLVYILREVENMTYYSIRDFFIENGRPYDHTTALHAYRNYIMFTKYSPQLKEYFNIVVEKSNTEKSKKLIAKSIIDTQEPVVAEIFTYMVNK